MLGSPSHCQPQPREDDPQQLVLALHGDKDNVQSTQAQASDAVGEPMDHQPDQPQAAPAHGDRQASREERQQPFVQQEQSALSCGGERLLEGTAAPGPLISAVMQAAFVGDEEALRAALQTPAAAEAVDAQEQRGGHTALMFAAVAGHAGAVRTLLSHGASLSLRSRHGRTAHDMALLAGHGDCLRALRSHVPLGVLLSLCACELPPRLRLETTEARALCMLANGEAFLPDQLAGALGAQAMLVLRVAECLEVAAAAVARFASSIVPVLRLCLLAAVIRDHFPSKEHRGVLPSLLAVLPAAVAASAALRAQLERMAAHGQHGVEELDSVLQGREQWVWDIEWERAGEVP